MRSVFVALLLVCSVLVSAEGNIPDSLNTLNVNVDRLSVMTEGALAELAALRSLLEIGLSTGSTRPPVTAYCHCVAEDSASNEYCVVYSPVGLFLNTSVDLKTDVVEWASAASTVTSLVPMFVERPDLHQFERVDKSSNLMHFRLGILIDRTKTHHIRCTVNAMWSTLVYDELIPVTTGQSYLAVKRARGDPRTYLTVLRGNITALAQLSRSTLQCTPARFNATWFSKGLDVLNSTRSKAMEQLWGRSFNSMYEANFFATCCGGYGSYIAGNVVGTPTTCIGGASNPDCSCPSARPRVLNTKLWDLPPIDQQCLFASLNASRITVNTMPAVCGYGDIALYPREGLAGLHVCVSGAPSVGVMCNQSNLTWI